MGSGAAPPRNVLDFYSLKSPFPGFRVIQAGCRPDFNLESVFIIKNIFNMKNVTDFRETVETGVETGVDIDIVKRKLMLVIFGTYGLDLVQ